MISMIGRIAATALLSATILLGAESCSILNGQQGQPGAQAPQSAATSPATTAPPAAPAPAQAASAQAVPAQSLQAAPAAQSAQNFTGAVRQVTEKVRPAVVQITSSQNAGAG